MIYTPNIIFIGQSITSAQFFGGGMSCLDTTVPKADRFMCSWELRKQVHQYVISTIFQLIKSILN